MLLSLLLLDPYDDEEGNSLSLQLSVLLATPVCSLKRFVDPPVVFPELLVKATTTLLTPSQKNGVSKLNVTQR